MKQETAGRVLTSYRDVIAQIVDGGGEVTPELETALVSIDVKLPAAVDTTATIMERLEHEEEYWKEKAEAYSKIAKGLSNTRTRIKDHLKFLMDQAGMDELKGHDVRFKLSNTKPKLVINEDILDSGYLLQVTTTVPDKKRIEEDLKLGVPVEGAMLIETKSLRSYANTKAEK